MELHTRDTTDKAAPWVEVEHFEYLTLDQGYADVGILEVPKKSERDILVALSTEVMVESSVGRQTLKRRDWIEIPEGGVKLTAMRPAFVAEHNSPPYFLSELLHISGSWQEVNHLAIFQIRPDRPLEVHYHDYNEYWFMYRGRFDATYNGQTQQISQGQMLATPAGHEHGILQPTETVEGIAFQTTLIGQKRQGKLTREVYGAPTPPQQSV